MPLITQLAKVNSILYPTNSYINGENFVIFGMPLMRKCLKTGVHKLLNMSVHYNFWSVVQPLYAFWTHLLQISYKT
jgi:hypothetical protein